jgi:hypothetical protein
MSNFLKPNIVWATAITNGIQFLEQAILQKLDAVRLFRRRWCHHPKTGIDFSFTSNFNF